MLATLVTNNFPHALYLLPVLVIFLALWDLKKSLSRPHSLREDNHEDHWPFRHRGDERY